MTLGTCPYPYPRLLEWISTYIEKDLITEEVGLFIQHGSTPVPGSIQCHSWVGVSVFLPREEMQLLFQESDLIISHAGQGLTIELANRSARFVIVPRQSRYEEHIDNHQVLFANLVKRYGIVSCTTSEQLEKYIVQPPQRFNGTLFGEEKLADHLNRFYGD
ncbi:MAG: glycosyltransferase [Synechococcus sp.]